jgi:three-Cys-motif partner protein
MKESADDLPVLDVGPWVKRKHQIIRHYVNITSAVRRKFNGKTVFVDLYCGPGRAQIRDSNEVIDGSAVVAAKAAQDTKCPFREIHIADINEQYVSACAERLVGSTVRTYPVNATLAAQQIMASIDPSSFVIVLIDPFNIEGLDFEIFRQFAGLAHVDFIAHFSTMDVQMNVERYFAAEKSTLDQVAPGWRPMVTPLMNNEQRLFAVFEAWKSAIGVLGFLSNTDPQTIHNSKKRWIYWLALVSRHPLAEEFWGKVAQLEDQPQRKLF